MIWKHNKELKVFSDVGGNTFYTLSKEDFFKLLKDIEDLKERVKELEEK